LPGASVAKLAVVTGALVPAAVARLPEPELPPSSEQAASTSSTPMIGAAKRERRRRGCTRKRNGSAGARGLIVGRAPGYGQLEFGCPSDASGRPHPHRPAVELELPC